MSYGRIWIGATPDRAVHADLVSSRWQSDRNVVRCSLAADRDQAQALTGQTIFGGKARAQAKAGHGWLWAALSGVMLVGADGVEIGMVVRVYNAGASDIVEVEGPGGKRIDLPLIADYFDLEVALTPVVIMRVPSTTFSELWEDT